MYSYQEVTLQNEEYIQLDYDYYLFSICVNNQEVGRITYRLGSDQYFELDGHIGYEIEKEYRGHHYAYKAVKAIIPLMHNYTDHILITCDPDNIASKKTIEKLGAVYMKNQSIPRKLQAYYPGSTSKDIYQLDIE